MCRGTKEPLAPNSARNPWTVETGFRRPFNTDSSKVPVNKKINLKISYCEVSEILLKFSKYTAIANN